MAGPPDILWHEKCVCVGGGAVGVCAVGVAMTGRLTSPCSGSIEGHCSTHLKFR